MATTAKTVRCLCSSFEFGEFDGENENAVSYDTNCAETTTRTFAMGHDAKLAGYLVRAEMAGEEIRYTTGGLAVHTDAVGAARKVSEAFTAKVVAQLDAAKARIAKKASKEATKAAKKSAKKAEAPAPAPTHELRNIKVGRWVYTARVDLATGEATYSNAKGATVTVAKGKYTEQ